MDETKRMVSCYLHYDYHFATIDKTKGVNMLEEKIKQAFKDFNAKACRDTGRDDCKDLENEVLSICKEEIAEACKKYTPVNLICHCGKQMDYSNGFNINPEYCEDPFYKCIGCGNRVTLDLETPSPEVK